MSEMPISHSLESETALSLQHIQRGFDQGPTRIEVLRGASLEIRRGEIVALVGPSGAGKSTLLHIAGLLERPDSGEIEIEGMPCSRLNDDQLTAVRRHRIGFVYQFHHLLPEFSALENIMLPQMIAGLGRGEARRRSNELLEMMQLSDRAEHRPAQLSGGEQQRIAIARAIANLPSVLLADEPTGNLDTHTADKVFAETVALVRQTGISALIATHNPELAARMDRIVRLEDGLLVPG
jgi:lipoprotein-releasing system ATP-binding protein